MGYNTPTKPSTVVSLQNNYVATTAPAVTDDVDAGYSVGSVWIDVTGDERYVCLDSSAGSAVWAKSTVGTATEVVNTPAGNIIATTVQTAINELDTEKANASDLSNVQNTKVNLSATADPTANDDTGDGYSVGSIWVNTTNDRVFICQDATSTSAVWEEMGNTRIVRSMVWQAEAGGNDLAVGDGLSQFPIPASLNGYNLISASAYVKTAGTTNASTFQLHNLTQTADMLSANISIASGATSGSGTVDATNDDVATGDIIRIDVDAVSTTAPQGLWVVLEFQKP